MNPPNHEFWCFCAIAQNSGAYIKPSKYDSTSGNKISIRFGGKKVKGNLWYQNDITTGNMESDFLKAHVVLSIMFKNRFEWTLCNVQCMLFTDTTPTMFANTSQLQR